MYKSGRVSIVKTTKYKIFLKFLLLTATLPASLHTDPVTEKTKKNPKQLTSTLIVSFAYVCQIEVSLLN